MDRLDISSYRALRAGAEVLEADGFGDKVLRLNDGRIIKLFRRKRLLSSASIYPYARRFVANARALEKIGVPVPSIVRLAHVREISRDVVIYQPLPGDTLRRINAAGLAAGQKARLRAALTGLIIRLHDAGIYFRSLHLGNVVCLPDERLGLIDFADLRQHPWPLGRYLRARNLRRMLAIADECDWVDEAAILAAAGPARRQKAPRG